ncbi:hypothetical protein Aam_121_003 [Acidocella aminolytica 101 = DSM 11237]|uniref:Uncharacterized protein n=1 Tax=Acidocella aminolytica 101 = DSM 11237 TaxID=1120923 RepID=A0A0D6PKV4_9PROT|nr:hypothetical protein [Acidocella aminolytica]GAN81833.1 hypothetical protein Aam_121_003 [Acidocella aminolytica 101 = DSM 11237]GBQ44116.1 hypothetical protein AA11237_3458 [Acidocella aminolytica 101 = DSM 11237]
MTAVVRDVGILVILIETIEEVCKNYRFEFYSNDLWRDRLTSMLQAVMLRYLAQGLPAVTVLGSGESIRMCFPQAAHMAPILGALL